MESLGDLVNFNPHVHVLAADGAFLAEGRFVALPAVPQAFLADGFRRAVLAFLVKNQAPSGAPSTDPASLQRCIGTGRRRRAH
jgi:hypothetical protein